MLSLIESARSYPALALVLPRHCNPRFDPRVQLLCPARMIAVTIDTLCRHSCKPTPRKHETCSLVPCHRRGQRTQPLQDSGHVSVAAIRCTAELMTAPQTAAVPLHAASVRAALHLKQRGWAVVEDVLTREECAEYVDSVWGWLEGLASGIRRDDPSTWSAPHWPPSYRGIINTLEVAHQAFVWRVRSHPRVVQVFQELWGTNELLSSFDSINVLPPTAATGIAPDTASWLHTDQAPLRKGLFCIQGIMNMVDVGPDTTGTLLVKDNSHAAHERFFANASVLSREEQEGVRDFYKLRPAELPFWEGFHSLPLAGAAGSLFLWDSRTIHANVLPEHTDAWRHVVYVCYQPRSMASEKDLEIKREAWDEHRITTHWPAANVEVFPDEDAERGYYGEAASGGEAKRRFSLTRTRAAVEEEEAVRQLAGVELYSAAEVWRRTPLLDLPDGELRKLCEQLV